MNPVWAYVSILDNLTGGDITKDEVVLDMEYVYCMERLLYRKEKDEWIDKMNRIQQKLAGLK